MLYPVFIKLSGKRCLVVGGGKVAGRKVVSLLKKGASVTVVSPDLLPNLKKMAIDANIKVVSSQFKEDMLEGFFLVIGATSNYETNRRVSEEAERLGILYNIVDIPEQCNFYVPSVMERGDLSIAISTNGKSPALAKRLRKRLEEEFGEEYALLLELMGEIREEAIRSIPDQTERSRLFETLLDSEDILELICQGKDEEAKGMAKKIAGGFINETGHGNP